MFIHRQNAYINFVIKFFYVCSEALSRIILICIKRNLDSLVFFQIITIGILVRRRTFQGASFVIWLLCFGEERYCSLAHTWLTWGSIKVEVQNDVVELYSKLAQLNGNFLEQDSLGTPPPQKCTFKIHIIVHLN